ncbi:unnamed protein product [Dracunculus medinensis]|uniref:Uncharacterized protein n=1 Tax=Dracunculus medinensis TaxID=318479 RepID=A0A0N4UB21_DRAME|nr:unnamed protein product [Dracunculus medinensis]
MATNLLATRGAFEAMSDQFNQMTQLPTNQIDTTSSSTNNWRIGLTTPTQSSFAENMVSTSLMPLDSDSYPIMAEQTSSANNNSKNNNFESADG